MILVLATENKDKGREIASIIDGQIHLTLRFITDYPGLTLPAETGATYKENAILKAKTVAEATSQWAMGDDSGLEIEALNGAPGLYSARFAGEQASYADNRKKALALLGDLPDEKRRARFVCTIALADPYGVCSVVEGVCEGRITHVEAGEGGFGYDPIFYLPHLGKTFSESTRDEKNHVSHRGIAIRAAIEILKEARPPAIIAASLGR